VGGLLTNDAARRLAEFTAAAALQYTHLWAYRCNMTTQPMDNTMTSRAGPAALPSLSCEWSTGQY